MGGGDRRGDGTLEGREDEESVLSPFETAKYGLLPCRTGFETTRDELRFVSLCIYTMLWQDSLVSMRSTLVGGGAHVGVEPRGTKSMFDASCAA